MKSKNQIFIYQTKNKVAHVEVQLEGDSVWLNRQQLALLFGRDVKTIGKHINNALREELAGISTVANFATVQMEGARQVERQVEHYNLDMILSVGYRVKSAEGVYFRRWATSILRQHILQGYTINEKRLQQLKRIIDVISRSDAPEISGLSSVLRQFTGGLDLLDDYDHQSVSKPEDTASGGFVLHYDEARALIDSMRFGGESPLFGREHNDSFKGTLGTIHQTFGGQKLYPGVFEKAANLLYLTVKNHSFTDGNKRIAAALFVYFLDKNNALRNERNALRIDSSTLAAVTLMIALSRPEEKEIMCALVMQMLAGEQESQQPGRA
jgi:prophage maintenance system killer protein